jgi:hypothetical protein
MMSARLVESDSQLFKLLYGAVCQQINRKVSQALPSITRQVRELVRRTLWEGDDIQALANPDSQISAILGFLRDNAQRLSAVIDRICGSTRITLENFRVTGAMIRGFLKVEILQASYGDILNLPEATITDARNSIPWIRLLLSGDKITLLDTEFSVLWKPDRRFSKSRQGSALMIRSQKGIQRIPPEFAGTITGNK